MRVDDRRHRVGRVMKTVYKFKTEGDQQGQSKEQIGPDTGDGDRVQVLRQMEADVAEASQKGQHERYEALTV